MVEKNAVELPGARCVINVGAVRLSARRDRKIPIQNMNENGGGTARNKWESRSTYFEDTVFSSFWFGRCEWTCG